MRVRVLFNLCHVEQCLLCFRIDLSVPNAADLLEEEDRGHTSQPKISDAWFPYESKTVSRPSKIVPMVKLNVLFIS